MPRVAKTKKQKAYSYRRYARANIPGVRGHGSYRLTSPSEFYSKLKGMFPKADPRYSYGNPGPWGKYGRIGGEMAGKAIGGPLGGAIGGKLGSYLHYIGKIFGSGDYVTSPGIVSSNSLLSPQAPQFSGHQTVRIKHREFLGDLVTSSTVGAFQLQNFSINPGQSQTFPWLSQVCGATYQQYRINGMVFEFRSMSADALNSTNTALGSVVMATDYDSADALFTNKAEMENTEFGVSCKPSSCMIHAIECKRNLTAVSELYIRATAVPSGSDRRLYDLGNFQVATVGFQGASVNIGELWVSYDISLIKTIMQPPGFLIPSAHYALNGTNLATQPLSILTTATNNYDGIGLTVDSTGLILTFPPSIPLNSVWMVWLEHLSTSGGAGAVSGLGFTPSGGLIQRPKVLHSAASGGINYPNPTTSSAATTRSVALIGFFTYTGGASIGSPPTLTFTASVTPFTGYAGGDLIVTMLNPNINNGV